MVVWSKPYTYKQTTLRDDRLAFDVNEPFAWVEDAMVFHPGKAGPRDCNVAPENVAPATLGQE